MTIELTIIIALAIFASPWILKGVGFNRDNHELQNIATSLGIMATFVGIAIGLWNFDVDNIDAAVPALLAGMKFAFFTSIAGLASSLTLKFAGAFGKDEEGQESKDPEEISALALSNILIELKTLNKNVNGEGDSSLVTQIQKMRTSITDKQDELNKEFKNFAEQMTKSNIDALAEAIEKVMGDFNTTVNEKLGETFDNFKMAVENLNQWQREYKDQIDSQTENMKGMKDALSDVSENVVSMTDSYEKISDISKQFDELIKNLNAQLQGSVDFSTSMKELSADMEGAGEAIKKEMKEITLGAADEMEKTMNKTLADFGSSLADISGKMADDFQRVQVMLSGLNR